MEQLKYALVLQHSCKVYHTTMLFTCFMCGRFVSILVAAGVSNNIHRYNVTGVRGDSETCLHFKSKFHWLSFFFCCFLFCFVVFCVFFLFQDLISLGVRGQIIPENLTLLLVRNIQVH